MLGITAVVDFVRKTMRGQGNAHDAVPTDGRFP